MRQQLITRRHRLDPVSAALVPRSPGLAVGSDRACSKLWIKDGQKMRKKDKRNSYSDRIVEGRNVEGEYNNDRRMRINRCSQPPPPPAFFVFSIWREDW
ncbi:hypothetical protein EVAR_100293_1 [Eumeta japonica]|uniref:Uncharacterized protein n=1 Tax=Eumeta variegata TaxID=151549 RepID=A0A4C2A7L8_EUMVA|nr:hypothetical protein EVAR_100293_1 [Eumeta japonica]